MPMPDGSALAIIAFLPALVFGVLILGALFAVTRRVDTFWLRVGRLFWVLLLLQVTVFVTVSMTTCAGSLVDGFFNCTILPPRLADYSLTLFLVTFAAAGLYGVIVASVMTVLKWRG